MPSAARRISCELRAQRVELRWQRIGDCDLLCAPAACEQPADEAARHVAAANESNRGVHLVGQALA
jgi:hypothetical protein